MPSGPKRIADGSDQGCSGYTLLEIIAVMLILSILVLLIVPNYKTIVAKAQEMVCASNMRSIRLGLDQYLQDHKMIWPQAPETEDDDALSAFWVATLQPYDISLRTWQCPTIRSMMRDQGQREDKSIHYAPTSFDPTPNIAYRWATQPWLIEVGDAHGKGPLICFPDGSIKPLFKVLAEQGVR
jgi:prepilin-type N-terminal cleavage/methylation domain-containing protein